MPTLARNRLLEHPQEVFGLTTSDVARLYGVSRQAVDQWHDRGIPAAHQQKAAAVAAVADLLSHRLKPERIPGIARRPARGYGGRTMLEMIAQNRHLELLNEVRRSFDWAATT